MGFANKLYVGHERKQSRMTQGFWPGTTGECWCHLWQWDTLRKDKFGLKGQNQEFNFECVRFAVISSGIYQSGAQGTGLY